MAGRTPLDFFMRSFAEMTQVATSLEDKVKLQPLSKAKMTEIRGLEQGDQVYFYAAPTQDDAAPGGYLNLWECVILLVEKETGSNGKIWRHDWVETREDCEQDGDGLSSRLAYCAQPCGIDESIPYDSEIDYIVSTVTQACLRLPQSCRPRKVLFRATGPANALSKKLKKMGIYAVGIAEDNLVTSMTSGFTNKSRNRGLEQVLPANLSNLSPHALAEAVSGALRPPESPYVSEERVPLGRYRPDIEDLALFPLE